MNTIDDLLRHIDTRVTDRQTDIVRAYSAHRTVKKLKSKTLIDGGKITRNDTDDVCRCRLKVFRHFIAVHAKFWYTLI